MSTTLVNEADIVWLPGTRRSARSDSPVVQVTVTVTLPPGLKLARSTLTLKCWQVMPRPDRAVAAASCAWAAAVTGSLAIDAARAAWCAASLITPRASVSRPRNTMNSSMITSSGVRIVISTAADPRSPSGRPAAPRLP